ncbi:PQQ-like beta-propeller repeat protein, partial [Candidatus Desantisbacteria bacterium]|nr:PQQ-like beta-propeller repeat protein [Candidatus Desantisbacteria bacterium]
KIFFGTNDGIIHCLDAINGSEKWKNKIKRSISTSFLFYQERLYFGSNDTNLYCYEANNGKLLWKFKTDGAVSSAPQIFKNVILISSIDGHIYAIDSYDGQELWEINTGVQKSYYPIAIDKKNNLVFIINNDQNICAIEPKSGEIKWEFTAQHIGLNPEIISVENMILAASFDGMLYSIDVTEGKLIWNIKTDVFVYCDPP